MVARRHIIVQGGDSPQALRGWGHPDLPSLTAGDIRALLRHSKSHSTTRMLYAILLLHADARGTFVARNDEIAEAAGLKNRQARALMYRLRNAGEIVVIRPGTSRLPTKWHIAAIGRWAA